MTTTLPGSLFPLQARLQRIEGQTRALVRMYEAGRPTTELLDLVASIRAALGGLGLALVAHEATSGTRAGPLATDVDDERLADVMTLVQRLVRCT